MGTGNYIANEFRTCGTTSLPVCLHGQRFIKLNAVAAVVCLLIGAVAAILLALTRWPAVHLLDPLYYYRFVTVHGINMLIFWIIFMEVAILYFTGTVLLNCRLSSPKWAWVSFVLMAAGAALTNFIIFAGKADVLMTSYVPLRADPLFYVGMILFAVGTLIGILIFFGNLYISRRDRTYEGSMPLVTFGATAAAIIGFFTIVHGAVALIPTLAWSLGWIQDIDAGWYRITWWGLGHPSQQINVCAMVSVWYLLATLTVGAQPLNQAVCRSAFVLYILFINLASAHHLLVDPGLSAGWKIWNTSYAMYLAVLASMIHGFTVPASIEVAMRDKGYRSGLFSWLTHAPWWNPGFSSMFLSLVIFGFIGGITGVTLGTQQINIIAHNTLRIPGHFHATVVGGTTLAFMGLAYYVVPLIFQREYSFKALVRWIPYLFGIGIVMVSFGMTFAGSYGVPRRTAGIDYAGAVIPAEFGAGAHLALGVLGIGGVLAFTGLLLFILTTVHAVFLGRRITSGAMESWGEVAPNLAGERRAVHVAAEAHATPGTMTLVTVLLVSFAVYYFANWKALADVWQVR